MLNAKTDQFWTLFGDLEGHRTVNGADMYYFRQASFDGAGNANFTAADYGGNGQTLDFSAQSTGTSM